MLVTSVGVGVGVGVGCRVTSVAIFSYYAYSS